MLVVIFMQALIHNRYAGWGIRILLVLAAAGLLAAFSFHEGKLSATKRLTVTLANEGCFNCWAGLRVLKNTNDADLALLLDREMDLTGAMLAGMALKHPDLIQRSHYNLLLKVQAYRKQYGRDYQRGSGPDPDDADRKIAEAIAYLKSIHNTNEWFPYQSEAYDILRDVQKATAKPGR